MAALGGRHSKGARTIPVSGESRRKEDHIELQATGCCAFEAAVLNFPQPSGTTINRWCVNAASNSGNSGGPLLDIENGEVIGVVSSKLAPISDLAKAALSALEGQKAECNTQRQNPTGPS